jgi:FKBP-type peptidyl-prolyl cis-trans isomerase FkpA
MSKNIFIFRILPIIILDVFLYACQQEEKQQRGSYKSQQLKETLTRSNQSLISLETEKINAYIVRYQWDMQQTGSGLYYYIYKETSGLHPKKGDSIIINFSNSLLNGQKLYSSAAEGPLRFVAGKGKIISGLEEGIFLMQVGEKAKFIIPSHLAYGLLGDQNKIPVKATLVYDVELTSVIKRK